MGKKARLRGARRLTAAGLVGLAGLLVVGMAGTAGGASASGSRAARSTGPHRGGTLTVLESSANVSWPDGLNPSTNANAGSDQTINDAVFGELFELVAGGKSVGDLASGYQLRNGGKTLVIQIRPGVVFSDGTPFDAAAVAWNFRKDLKASCTCAPQWPGATISTAGRDTVVVHLQHSDGAIINQFQGSIANWTVSPTAAGKASAAAFAAAPVGAGPFVIQSNTPSSRIVLRRNPRYWQKGHPYLSGLVFQTTANDESALEDLRSGAGQVYEYMGTASLVGAFKGAGFHVLPEASTSVNAVQLDTLQPPFNNLAAREAVYYATDAPALDKALNHNAFPVTQSFTSPTGLFYEPTVPGYRTYDLQKAQALVKQLGGLSFTLLTVAQAGGGAQLAEAIQAMYAQAGIKVTLDVVSLPQLIQDLEGHHWQASMAAIGSFDPGGSFGLSFRYLGGFAFSGTDDPHLDALMAAGVAAVNPTSRAKIYASIAHYLSSQAYSPFLYPSASWNIAAKGVQGPGLTSTLPVSALSPEIPWEDVSMHNP